MALGSATIFRSSHSASVSPQDLAPSASVSRTPGSNDEKAVEPGRSRDRIQLAAGLHSENYKQHVTIFS